MFLSLVSLVLSIFTIYSFFTLSFEMRALSSLGSLIVKRPFFIVASASSESTSCGSKMERENAPQ